MSDMSEDDNRRDFISEMRSWFSPPSPIPADAHGYEALDAFFEIGLFCGLGIPPNESQCHFLHALSTKLLAELNVPSTSATDALARAFGVNQRYGGGGPADEWRRKVRDRTVARNFVMALFANRDWTTNDAVEEERKRLGLHDADTVLKIVMADPFSAEMAESRKRPRGRPRKRTE
jgi:hypothetical protein